MGITLLTSVSLGAHLSHAAPPNPLALAFSRVIPSEPAPMKSEARARPSEEGASTGPDEDVAPGYDTLARREPHTSGAATSTSATAPGFASISVVEEPTADLQSLMQDAWSEVLAERRADRRPWQELWREAMREGAARMERKQLLRANESFRDAARLAWENGHREGSARALRGMARTYVLGGDLRRARLAQAKAEQLLQGAGPALASRE